MVKVRGEGELTQAERDREGPNLERGWTGYEFWAGTAAARARSIDLNESMVSLTAPAQSWLRVDGRRK
jgi:hypothetical protein